jgi:tRNA threonylcarbamoyladenosine biosynthesis protein TsaB
MKILALEFSSEHRGVAVTNGEELLGQALETTGRETHPFTLIRAALEQARCSREEIQRLVVGLGPGSYNGIRTALAVAQGWHLARGLELGGVASVDSLAEALRQRGVRGRIQVSVDAQRGEFYLAPFELDSSRATALAELRIVQRAAIEALLADGEPVYGPPAPQGPTGVQTAYPSAAALARLAVERFAPCAPEQLEPLF